MKKETFSKKWIACTLSLLTFFVLFSMFSVSTVLSDSDTVQANLVVIPTEKALCFPKTFISNELFGNITCFIEVGSALPGIIIPSSLRLGVAENPATGIPPVVGSPIYINDFNNNGIQDLFVQFDASQFRNFLSGLSLPGNYHYRLTGNINIIPYTFTQTEIFLAKSSIPQPSRSTRLIDYTTTFNGNDGNVVIANGFALSQFTQTTGSFDGYFVQRVNYPSESVTSWGNANYNSRGYLTVDFTIFPWLPPLFSMKVSESLTVVDDGFHSCSSTTNSMTICQSSGWMIKQGSGIFADRGQTRISTFIYIISPTSTKIYGFDSSNNMILKIQDINLNSLSVTPMIPS